LPAVERLGPSFNLLQESGLIPFRCSCTVDPWVIETENDDIKKFFLTGDSDYGRGNMSYRDAGELSVVSRIGDMNEAVSEELYCQFGKRFLDGFSWLAPLTNNRLGDALNIEFVHEQLFSFKATAFSTRRIQREGDAL